jgi:ATPase family associated with various cellular activities (AAA)
MPPITAGPVAAASPAAVPVAGRGSDLLRRVRRARDTHRPLALSGHVDDLYLTTSGPALRLPETLAMGGSADGVSTIVASEARGAVTLTPPGAASPARPVRLAPAGLRELLGQLVTQAPALLAGQPAQLLLLGFHGALDRDDDLAEYLLDLPFDHRLASGMLHVIASFRATDPAILQGATGWETHRILLPDRAERRAALGYWERIGVLDPRSLGASLGPAAPGAGQRGALGTAPRGSLDSLALVTGGLELDDLRRLVEEHSRVEPLTPTRVSEVRAAALTRQLGDLVRVDHRPATTFDDVVGGEAAKAAALECQANGRFDPLALVGPPGTGKTELAKAIAHALSLPIAFADSRLKGGIVGETGRNLTRLREMLVAYAPVVAFWDEIDLLLGRSTDWNGDSGASNEVRQAVLTLLQDAPELGIFVIASSNNPFSALQYRMRDRFPHLIPVLHLAPDDAVDLASKAAAANGATLAPDAADLIRSTQDVLWNGRNIARMIADACSNVARLRGLQPSHPISSASQVQLPRLELTAADLRLLIRHLAAARDEAAVLNALEAIHVVHNPFDLPWIARQLAGRPRPQLPAYLDGMLTADGLPDRRLIEARLAAAGVRDAG